MDDIRTNWMNIVFLRRISALVDEYTLHHMNIICCSSISSVVDEYHPTNQISVHNSSIFSFLLNIVHTEVYRLPQKLHSQQAASKLIELVYTRCLLFTDTIQFIC
jgi:hypothetical protein